MVAKTYPLVPRRQRHRGWIELLILNLGAKHMDQHQRELRRAAAEAFMESLDQLQETLLPAEPQLTQSAQPVKSKVVKPQEDPRAIQFDLASLEQAAADIEEFMQAKKTKES